MKAPKSMAIAPNQSSCEAIRVNSLKITRIYLARSGTSIAIPFSTSNAQPKLLM